jgi:hypothetical protein
LQWVFNFNSSFWQVNESMKEGTSMHKLTHQFVANTTNPGRCFDAGSNLHLLVRSGATMGVIALQDVNRKLQALAGFNHDLQYGFTLS